MGAPKFQYKKPLVVKLGTGVSGSRNGVDFTTREFFGKNDQNVTRTCTFWDAKRALRLQDRVAARSQGV